MSRRQRWFMESVGTEYDTGEERVPVKKNDERANLLSSAIETDVNAGGFVPDARHKPVLDIDLPVVGEQTTSGWRMDITLQHFIPQAIDRLSEVLIDLGLAEAVTSDGRTNCIRIYWRVPLRLQSSFTPGHYHLFIDVTLTWAKYARLLDALADAQVIEHGYLMASLERGATFVALKPWKDRHRAVAN